MWRAAGGAPGSRGRGDSLPAAPSRGQGRAEADGVADADGGEVQRYGQAERGGWQEASGGAYGAPSGGQTYGDEAYGGTGGGRHGGGGGFPPAEMYGWGYGGGGAGGYRGGEDGGGYGGGYGESYEGGCGGYMEGGGGHGGTMGAGGGLMGEEWGYAEGSGWGAREGGGAHEGMAGDGGEGLGGALRRRGDGRRQQAQGEGGEEEETKGTIGGGWWRLLGGRKGGGYGGVVRGADGAGARGMVQRTACAGPAAPAHAAAEFSPAAASGEGGELAMGPKWGDAGVGDGGTVGAGAGREGSAGSGEAAGVAAAGARAAVVDTAVLERAGIMTSGLTTAGFKARRKGRPLVHGREGGYDDEGWSPGPDSSRVVGWGTDERASVTGGEGGSAEGEEVERVEGAEGEAGDEGSADAGEGGSGGSAAGGDEEGSRGGSDGEAEEETREGERHEESAQEWGPAASPGEWGQYPSHVPHYQYPGNHHHPGGQYARQQPQPQHAQQQWGQQYPSDQRHAQGGHPSPAAHCSYPHDQWQQHGPHSYGGYRAYPGEDGPLPATAGSAAAAAPTPVSHSPLTGSPGAPPHALHAPASQGAGAGGWRWEGPGAGEGLWGAVPAGQQGRLARTRGRRSGEEAAGGEGMAVGGAVARVAAAAEAPTVAGRAGGAGAAAAGRGARLTRCWGRGAGGGRGERGKGLPRVALGGASVTGRRGTDVYEAMSKGETMGEWDKGLGLQVDVGALGRHPHSTNVSDGGQVVLKRRSREGSTGWGRARERYVSVVVAHAMQTWPRIDFSLADAFQWLELARYSGMSHVFWYDMSDDPRDSMEAALKPYERDGFVTYHHFPSLAPSLPAPHLASPRDQALHHCLTEHGATTVWLLPLTPVDYPSVPSDIKPGFADRFLRAYEARHPSAAQLLLQTFLFLGAPQNASSPLIQRYQRRTNQSDGVSLHPQARVVPVVRPDLVARVLWRNPSHLLMTRGSTMALPAGAMRVNRFASALQQMPGTEPSTDMVLDASLQPLVPELAMMVERSKQASRIKLPGAAARSTLGGFGWFRS
ncbi:hypothetical protein CLOP_g22954 [Closterium sp. NIES-67]|nr:hypothetical protein CLOP_g22954 [Closterium sp. NIES-67]